MHYSCTQFWHLTITNAYLCQIGRTGSIFIDVPYEIAIALNHKILHLERKFTTATETFIVNQINALDTLDHHVFTIDFLDLLEAKAKIYHPKKATSFSTKVMVNSHRKFFKEHCAELKPTLIHGHYITDALVFRPFTKNLTIPKICSCYGYDVSVIPVKFKLLYKRFYRKIFDEYDLFLAMTDEMKKDLLEIGCPEDKIKVHYHGINTKQFDVARGYDLTDEHLYLLTIASLYEVKGHMSVLTALASLLRKHPHLKIAYDIVGEGPLEKELKGFVKQHGLGTAVKFRGALKHGPEFNRSLQKANVFLHPSITTSQNDKEGIPGAIVEAMASGLPVIATWHGGIPAVIKNKKTGFLVEENDAENIEKRLLQLHDSKELRMQIGNAAKKYAVEHLDVYQKAKELETIYSNVLYKKKRNCKKRQNKRC